MRAICFLPAVLALVPALSWGLDPMTADILTLRLGMRSAEAMAHLAIQGAPVT